MGELIEKLNCCGGGPPKRMQSWRKSEKNWKFLSFFGGEAWSAERGLMAWLWVGYRLRSSRQPAKGKDEQPPKRTLQIKKKWKIDEINFDFLLFCCAPRGESEWTKQKKKAARLTYSFGGLWAHSAHLPRQHFISSKAFFWFHFSFLAFSSSSCGAFDGIEPH